MGCSAMMNSVFLAMTAVLHIDNRTLKGYLSITTEYVIASAARVSAP